MSIVYLSKIQNYYILGNLYSPKFWRLHAIYYNSLEQSYLSLLILQFTAAWYVIHLNEIKISFNQPAGNSVELQYYNLNQVDEFLYLGTDIKRKIREAITNWWSIEQGQF